MSEQVTVGHAGCFHPELVSSVPEPARRYLLHTIAPGAALASKIELDKIQSLVIEPSMTLSYMAPTDPPQAVLIPIREEIRKLRARFLDAGGVAAPEAADDPTRLAAEAAAIRVENGTQTPGLAARTRDFLNERGFVVADVGDAFDGLTDHAATLIIDHGNKPFTAAKLAEALGLPPAAIRTAATNGDGVDVRIVLGSDFASMLGAQLLLTPAPTATAAP